MKTTHTGEDPTTLVLGNQPRSISMPSWMRFVSVLAVESCETMPLLQPQPSGLCFASPHSVRIVCESSIAKGTWSHVFRPNLPIYAIGKRSSELLQTYGHDVAMCADTWSSLEAMVVGKRSRLISPDVGPWAPLLFPRVEGEPDPPSRLALQCVAVYRTTPIVENLTDVSIHHEQITVACALSPKCAAAFLGALALDVQRRYRERVRWVAIGPTTAARCRELGIRNLFIASHPTFKDAIDLCRRLNQPTITIVGGGGTLGNALQQFWPDHTIVRTSTSNKPSCERYVSPDPSTLLHIASESKSNVLIGAVAPIQAKFRGIGLNECDAFYDIIQSTYLDTARDVAETAKQLGAHLIWISSHNVYPNRPDGGIVDESTPAGSRHRTAAILDEAERIVQTHPLTTVLRLAWLEGPQRTWEGTMRKLQHVTIRGGQENAQMNTTSMVDACRAIEHVIAHRLLGIYDCAQWKGCTWREHWTPICREHSIPEPAYDASRTDFWFEGNHRLHSLKLQNTGFKFSVHAS